MRRNSVNPASDLKTVLTPHHRVQRPRFLIKGLKLWQFDKTISEFWAYFHRACAETAIYELPVKNLTPLFAPVTSISSKTDAFPLYRVTFTGYIRCFCATTSHDLVTLTFDLLTLRMCHVQCFSCLTHIPIFYYPMTIGYWVTSIEYLIHFRYLKQSLRMRRVT